MYMDKQQFEKLFDAIIVSPLESSGFERKGKSVYLVQSDIAISLMRLGGRMAIWGGISQILCFRHSFLSTLYEESNFGFESEVFSYPVKLKPLDVKHSLRRSIKYRPTNSRLKGEEFVFDDKSEKQVLKYLSRVLKSVNTVHGWAQRIEPDQLSSEIKKFGESAWIENRWLDSYEARKNI